MVFTRGAWLEPRSICLVHRVKTLIKVAACLVLVAHSTLSLLISIRPRGQRRLLRNPALRVRLTHLGYTTWCAIGWIESRSKWRVLVVFLRKESSLALHLLKQLELLKLLELSELLLLVCRNEWVSDRCLGLRNLRHLLRNVLLNFLQFIWELDGLCLQLR